MSELELQKRKVDALLEEFFYQACEGQPEFRLACCALLSEIVEIRRSGSCHLAYWITDRIIEFLHQQKKDRKNFPGTFSDPFFCLLSAIEDFCIPKKHALPLAEMLLWDESIGTRKKVLQNLLLNILEDIAMDNEIIPVLERFVARSQKASVSSSWGNVTIFPGPCKQKEQLALRLRVEGLIKKIQEVEKS